MARPASSRLQGLITVSGMVAFIGAVSIAPRISILKTDDSTIIKYDHLSPKSKHQTPAPADPGLIITPSPKPQSSPSSNSSNENKSRKPFSPDDWIFDTGATTHVCANRALLHSYDTLNPYNNSVNPRAVGYFGPNPVPIVGAGDCTFILPGDELPDTSAHASSPTSSSSSAGSHSRTTSDAKPSSMLTSLLGTGPARRSSSTMAGGDRLDAARGGVVDDQHIFNNSDDKSSLSPPLPPPPHYKAVTRLTVKNVMHIPTAGVNLISWSQLKRAKGLQLRLVEEPDGSLTVQHQERGVARTLMRFEPRDGLFFLVQANVSPSVRREIER
ncbi:hypothetical protein HRR83_008062 [Exophiala dermatitidis]|uniref:Uncharacterized protein n=2 Tax=Exophiala dermatitidis TaxID=5970 RepID=H6BTF8_EXODN|nr:uncharacterized protein HMPREF1120_02525 [Exophiala dermatitidis NIH/UT8656]KAJ4503313.1 hypothetical protein HRR75_008096 [Exophiala dermatitidis]EHY54355.1 hypothetical protein HMPREF1120_02525 [Exophiala dermatitidis NIH/UT8656]KAJ4504984.1 hypothetical protein HRR74_008812 [Exophiala dermatitidis]KAJ4513492.1 hypothetical protein HRR73_005650 [Exophiala dermatitidis]KAJ4535732.1 hypothetical protein HRR77_007679 [Exophiala dermatitidis]